MSRAVVKKQRFKYRIRIGQVITSKRPRVKTDSLDPGAQYVKATIRQVWRKDAKAHVVFHDTGDDIIIPFVTLQKHWTCSDWDTIYVKGSE